MISSLLGTVQLLGCHRALQVIVLTIHFHTISMMPRLLNEFLARPPVLMHRHEMESAYTLFRTCKRPTDDL